MIHPLKLLCPNCRKPLDAATLSCRSGHRFREEAEVLILLSTGFEEQAVPFLSRFSQIRRQDRQRLLAPEDYPQLPYGKRVAAHPEWRQRQRDWQTVQRLLSGRTARSVLEIGSYNGWLTHRLAGMGYQVTAVDYFLDDLDGLKTRRFYRESWQAVQMDVRDLSLFEERFDVIVVNHCLQFFEDPVEYFRQLPPLLSPTGMIILIGLQFFFRPQWKIRQIRRRAEAFEAQHGMKASFVPFKGYLDGADFRRLRQMGVLLFPAARRLVNLLARGSLRRPGRYYGVFRSGHS